MQANEKKSYLIVQKKASDAYITDHFKLSEFACPCCNRVSVDSRLIALLEKFRTEIGRPLIITSGYRCPTHNRRVGGAKRSRHLITDAADVACPSHIRYEDFFLLATEIFPRVGAYPQNFIHVDLCGRHLYWWRTTDGRYIYKYSPKRILPYIRHHYAHQYQQKTQEG